MKSVAVFCGSSPGNNNLYHELAAGLGRKIAGRGLELVYGGASVGLMGILADSVLAAGGRVTGVIPDFFSEKEIAHPGLDELIYVPSMHERKLRIAELSDAFIAIPGGFGTLDELFEITTWGQLDLHRKPVGILNTGGYFDTLFAFLDHMLNEGFLRPAHHAMIIKETEAGALLEKMEIYQPPDQSKWINSIKV